MNGPDLVFRKLGILDANREFVKRGAQVGLYYFVLNHAASQGIGTVDITVTSPFLNDGLFRHKTAWGSKISGNAESPRPIHLLLDTDPASAARLFGANPMVVAGADRLQALMGDASIDVVTAERHREIQSRCRALGISTAVFHTAKTRVVIETRTL